MVLRPWRSACSTVLAAQADGGFNRPTAFDDYRIDGIQASFDDRFDSVQASLDDVLDRLAAPLDDRFRPSCGRGGSRLSPWLAIKSLLLCSAAEHWLNHNLH